MRDKASNLPSNKFEKISNKGGAAGLHGYAKSNKSEMKIHK